MHICDKGETFDGMENLRPQITCNVRYKELIVLKVKNNKS